MAQNSILIMFTFLLPLTTCPIAGLRVPAEGASESQPRAGMEAKKTEYMRRIAGKSRGGLVLETLVKERSPALGEPLHLVISLKNVSTRVVRARKDMGDLDYIIAMDDSSNEEIPRIKRMGPSLSQWTYTIAPGHAIGAVFRLDELFEIKKPGEYTVNVHVLIWTEGIGFVVAEPLKVTIRPRREAELPPDEKLISDQQQADAKKITLRPGAMPTLAVGMFGMPENEHGHASVAMAPRRKRVVAQTLLSPGGAPANSQGRQPLVRGLCDCSEPRRGARNSHGTA